MIQSGDVISRIVLCGVASLWHTVQPSPVTRCLCWHLTRSLSAAGNQPSWFPKLEVALCPNFCLLPLDVRDGCPSGFLRGAPCHRRQYMDAGHPPALAGGWWLRGRAPALLPVLSWAPHLKKLERNGLEEVEKKGTGQRWHVDFVICPLIL